MHKAKLSTWLLKGTYPRLYLPILLIIALVSGIRYHVLLSAEKQEANARAAIELQRIGLIVLPLLAQAAEPARSPSNTSFRPAPATCNRL